LSGEQIRPIVPRSRGAAVRARGRRPRLLHRRGGVPGGRAAGAGDRQPAGSADGEVPRAPAHQV